MKKLILCFIVLVFTVAPAGANLVVDGSFEFGYSGADLWVAVAVDGGTFGAWTFHSPDLRSMWLGVDTVDSVMNNFIIPDGTSLAHTGDAYGFNWITQLVSGFVVGGTYEVSLAGVAYAIRDPLWGILEVYDPVGDPCEYDLQVNFDVAEPLRRDDTPMLYSSYQFIASNTELELAIIDPQDHALNIDDVSIELILIPEPATICLLGLGGLLLRRRR